MSYAIIQLVGKQFRVEEGKTFITDRITDKEIGDLLKVTDVLLVADEKSSTIGTPIVKGAEVTLKLIENGRGKKIRVVKYKSKSRYRKITGHKQHQSTLEVVKIKA
ncbi:50S ribosomal protein L21 [Patescibacteria group bacterium]|nr:50S ribosomal protein L21 [Patescibacteria group bacterium]